MKPVFAPLNIGRSDSTEEPAFLRLAHFAGRGAAYARQYDIFACLTWLSFARIEGGRQGLTIPRAFRSIPMSR
jgi:hypothetical protein